MLLKPLISAPVDITIMLLGAFLIGYVIAWLMRNARISDLKKNHSKLEQQVRNLNIDNENLDIAKDQLQDKLNDCEESKDTMIGKDEIQRANSEFRKERERYEIAQHSLAEIERAHEALKQELQNRIDQMLSVEEANKLRAEINRLRVFNSNLEDEVIALKEQNQGLEMNQGLEIEVPVNDIDTAFNPGHEFVSSIGIKSASEHEKDDLKKISGVGPFIENKLNHIGIYTFEQIASMTNEQAEKINEAIEFFPGRIQRDDWVGQAERLLD